MHLIDSYSSESRLADVDWLVEKTLLATRHLGMLPSQVVPSMSGECGSWTIVKRAGGRSGHSH